ncbi:hypothetical protein ASB57_09895 [Bordetella sp. N]|nr:hypothetical protein ASB57_09895 [Bordetella sp. N]
MALGFGVNALLFDGAPLRQLATPLSRASDDAWTGVVLTVSLLGLTGVAFVCWRAWRRRADLTEYWYLGALGLGVYGYVLAWTTGGVLLGTAMTIAEGREGLLNLPKAVLGSWAFAFMGLIFNVINLLLIVPQVIWCWQRTVHRARLRAIRNLPAPDRSAAASAESQDLPSPLPRRRVLAAWGAGLISLVALDHYFTNKRWPFKELRVVLGEDVNEWMQARGADHFESYYDEQEPSRVWTVKGQIPATMPAIFEHGDVRVFWHGIRSFSLLNMRKDETDHRIRASEWLYESQEHYSHEEGLSFVQATLAKFARGTWQAQTLPPSDKTLALTPGQTPSLAVWEPLVAQRKPLLWAWVTDGVRATLRVNNAWGVEPGDSPSYEVILRFEEV